MTVTWLQGVTGAGRIEVIDIEWLALEYICFHLRERDHAEIFNMSTTQNVLEITAIVMHSLGKNGVGWIAKFDHRPCAALGVFEQWPGNWQIFSFGTNDYPRAIASMWERYVMACRYAKDRGAHRLECRSRIGHIDAHRLLKTLGFRPEGTLEKYGIDKSDYVQWAQIL